MKDNLVILSPGMKSFQRLEELRILCRLGIDSIILRTGGFLDVSHVTYRGWSDYLKKIEIKAIEGKTIIAKSSPSYEVALKFEIVTAVLEDAYDRRLLPVDRSRTGVHQRHLAIMRMLKAQIVDILKHGTRMERLDDDRAKKIKEKHGNPQFKRHAYL